jgi:hypothetical protein
MAGKTVEPGFQPRPCEFQEGVGGGDEGKARRACDI